MCGPCEGYLFPGIFMHQLLPNRRRFGFGRTSFIALAEDIEIAGKKDDDAGDGSKNVSHCVLLSGTHTIRLFSLAITGRHVQPSEISYTALLVAGGKHAGEKIVERIDALQIAQPRITPTPFTSLAPTVMPSPELDSVSGPR